MTTNATKVSMTPAQRWVLALVSAASLMVVLDMLVVTTALNTIRLDLGASIQALEWTINAFTISFAVLLMPAAALGDRFGRKRLFLAGLALFIAASAACALAPNAGALITARAAQGIGSAMILPHAMALLSMAFGPEQRAKALGVFASITGLGTLGGPILGGAITQGLDWHWIFWINVPIGLVLLALATGRLEESTGPARRLDFGGLFLVAAAAFGLVWGLVRGPSVGWTSPEALGTLVGGALLGVVLVWWELRTAEPMLPMRFFKSPAFSAGNGAGFLLYGAMFGSAFFLTQFLQVTLGYGPFGAGLRLAPWTATVFVVSMTAGSLVNRFGERALIAGGLTLQAAGFAWIALIAKPDLAYPALVAPFIVAGCGTALAIPAAQNSVLGSVPRPAVGVASGVFNTLRQLSGAFGIAVLAAVFAGSGSYASPKSFSDGFVPAIAVAAAISFAGAVVGLASPGRRSPETPVAAPREAEPVLSTD
jgi:EmrB/QacA subfamily drug resistance transporter